METQRIAKINSTPVTVLSTGYEFLYKTDWKKAISDVFGGRAEIIESSDELWIGTSTGKFPFPIKVRYLSGIVLGKINRYYRTPRPSKKNLYYRDEGKCQYCKKEITLSNCTVDHVFPKSKGGKHEWSNIVLSCSSCNQKKGSKLLEDTGMKLTNDPRVPTIKEISKASSSR